MKARAILALALLAGCSATPPKLTARADACGGTTAPNEVCVPPAGSADAPLAEPTAKPTPTLTRMASIPRGTFEMGAEDGEPDERPVHAVTVGPFEIDLTEVTVGQYRSCVAKKACPPVDPTIRWGGVSGEVAHFHASFCNGPRDDRLDHPMNCVSWPEAVSYCRFAGKRLPTEEEWEYAARGSTGYRFPWGDQEQGPTLLNGCGSECVALARGHGEAWTADYPGSDGFASTAPVGSFPEGKSPFGVLDLAGNVWEWTASAQCDYGTSDCNEGHRIARGGGWSGDIAYRCNHWATYRGYGTPDERSDSQGFRCAR